MLIFQRIKSLFVPFNLILLNTALKDKRDLQNKNVEKSAFQYLEIIYPLRDLWDSINA